MRFPNADTATYPAQAVADSTDFTILTFADDGIGVVSGFAVTPTAPTSMNVLVASGAFTTKAGVSHQVANATSITIPPAGTGDVRNLIVAGLVNDTPKVWLVKGQPSPLSGWTFGTLSKPPIKPAIPNNAVAIAEIYVVGINGTATTAVTATEIVDKRVIVNLWQGSQGAQGSQGDTGAQGAQGRIGSAGALGNAGATGSRGSRGFQGYQGRKGNQGATGATGDAGDEGVSGRQGYQGRKGSQGIVGSQGYQGHIGYQGKAGSKGVPNSTTGPKGATGPQGAQGSGVAGPTGFAGIASTVQGPTGPAGFRGVQGAQGPQGVTVSTGATGTTGTRGNRGDFGATGATGPQGAGATGPQGVDGLGVGMMTHYNIAQNVPDAWYSNPVVGTPQPFGSSYAYFSGIYLPSGTTIHGFRITNVPGTSTASPYTGNTYHSWAVLTDSNKTVLVQSADTVGNVNPLYSYGSTAHVDFDVAVGASGATTSYTTAGSGIYYVGFFWPTFYPKQFSFPVVQPNSAGSGYPLTPLIEKAPALAWKADALDHLAYAVGTTLTPATNPASSNLPTTMPFVYLY
jgi:hypothetical protein